MDPNDNQVGNSDDTDADEAGEDKPVEETNKGEGNNPPEIQDPDRAGEQETNVEKLENKNQETIPETKSETKETGGEVAEITQKESQAPPILTILKLPNTSDDQIITFNVSVSVDWSKIFFFFLSQLWK